MTGVQTCALPICHLTIRKPYFFEHIDYLSKLFRRDFEILLLQPNHLSIWNFVIHSMEIKVIISLVHIVYLFYVRSWLNVVLFVLVVHMRYSFFRNHVESITICPHSVLFCKLNLRYHDYIFLTSDFLSYDDLLVLVWVHSLKSLHGYKFLIGSHYREILSMI